MFERLPTSIYDSNCGDILLTSSFTMCCAPAPRIVIVMSSYNDNYEVAKFSSGIKLTNINSTKPHKNNSEELAYQLSSHAASGKPLDPIQSKPLDLQVMLGIQSAASSTSGNYSYSTAEL